MRHLINLAGEEGFEPSLADSESAVLPLDYSPAHQNYSTKAGQQQSTNLVINDYGTTQGILVVEVVFDDGEYLPNIITSSSPA